MEKGLLLVLQGTKDAAVGMMRAKVGNTGMLVLIEGGINRQISGGAIKRVGNSIRLEGTFELY